ncbi:MAG: hypothetical protein EXS39_05280 [Opitutaceae bacterium]|nr:hypothetical protein [Opitutaceae bacterium]
MTGFTFFLRELRPGESLEVPRNLAEDMVAWHALGRASAVQWRLRFVKLEPAFNEVHVEFIETLLTESILRGINFHFRAPIVGVISPERYVDEYLMPPEHHPKRGDNRAEMILAKRDPQMPPFEVFDVRCSIDRRRHRHYEKRLIEY